VNNRFAIVPIMPVSWILFLLFFSIYLFTMSGQIRYGDEIVKYRVAQSIVDRGEFSIRRTQMKNDIGTGGQTYSAYELGQSVAMVPLYALGKAANRVFPQSDVNLLGQLFVGLLNPLVCALVCVIFFKSCRGFAYSQRTSIILTLILGLSTIVWPYSKGFTREPLLMLLLLISFYAIQWFEKTRRLAWLFTGGLASGLLAFTKLIQGAIVPILLLYSIILMLGDRRQSEAKTMMLWKPVLKGIGVFLLPFFLFLILQSLYALARFGTIYSGTGGTMHNPIDWILLLISVSDPITALGGLLFSPEKSILLYSPPILLFPIAWVKMAQRETRLALLILVFILVGWSSVITRPDWDGGTWWGPRYLVQITPFFLLPFGMLEEISKPWRQLWQIVLGMTFMGGLFVQIIGISNNSRDYFDVTRQWITLAGQLDLLRFGVVDSMMINIQTPESSWQVNTWGLLLLVIITLCLFQLMISVFNSRSQGLTSPYLGIAVTAFILAVESLGFIVWIVKPYPQVLAAQTSTQFVAGNALVAERRVCEALTLYSLAIERGTARQSEAVTRLNQLDPLPKGIPLSTHDFFFEEEIVGSAQIEEDIHTTISGNGSLRISAGGLEDVIARGHTQPMAVLPNTPYRISGWIKTENIYGSGFASVTVAEDNGAFRNIRDTDIVFRDETSGWSRFHKVVQTLPTTHRLFFSAGLWKTSGIAWIDGLEVARLPTEKFPQDESHLCK
jgi:hypothetical protein